MTVIQIADNYSFIYLISTTDVLYAPDNVNRWNWRASGLQEAKEVGVCYMTISFSFSYNDKSIQSVQVEIIVLVVVVPWVWRN